MKIEELVPIVYKGVRVLTGKQIAALYGVPHDRIKKNFRNAKKYFKAGEHFFKIEGDELIEIKEQLHEEVANIIAGAYQGKNFPLIKPESPLATYTRSAILYTAKGCVRHCKSLNSPTAWKVFGELEHTYFEPKEIAPIQSTLPFGETELLAPIVEPSPPATETKKASVYAFLMKNSLVKVGYSTNVKKRKEAFAGVVRTYASPEVAIEEAREIERHVKEKFYANKVEGEFFSMPFEEAVFEIRKYFTLDKPQHLDDGRIKLLVELCSVPLDCPEKILLFKETANLLLGRNLF